MSLKLNFPGDENENFNTIITTPKSHSHILTLPWQFHWKRRSWEAKKKIGPPSQSHPPDFCLGTENCFSFARMECPGENWKGNGSLLLKSRQWLDKFLTESPSSICMINHEIFLFPIHCNHSKIPCAQLPIFSLPHLKMILTIINDTPHMCVTCNFGQFNQFSRVAKRENLV